MASLMPFLSLIVVGAILGGNFYYRNKMRAQQEAQYANYKLADVARGIGLAVVEGDPALNLMLVHAAHADAKEQAQGNLLQKVRGDSARETAARAAGQVWGRPYELRYSQRTELEHSIGLRTWTLYFDFTLACATTVDVPPFEIIMRNPPQYSEPKVRTALPPQPTGNSALDSMIVVKTQDPRFAAALVPALVPLMTLTSIHLVGDGRSIRAESTQYTYMILLMNIATFQRSLEQIACTIEGRPATHLAAPASA